MGNDFCVCINLSDEKDCEGIWRKRRREGEGELIDISWRMEEDKIWRKSNEGEIIIYLANNNDVRENR